MKFNLKKFPVAELHSEFMQGRLPETGLCRLLRLGQVEEFISYHEKVKLLLNNLVEAADQDDSSKQKTIDSMEEFVVQNPELGSFVYSHCRSILNGMTVPRMWLKLNQLDNIIERDMEKSILRRKGKSNVVRRGA